MGTLSPLFFRKRLRAGFDKGLSALSHPGCRCFLQNKAESSPAKPIYACPNRQSSSAFTIVELLIVVVVIAILATIAVVAYGGISQRATNTSIVSSARSSLNLVVSYIGSTGAYPATTNRCLVAPEGLSSCQFGTGNTAVNAALVTALATVGKVPTAVPNTGGSGANYIEGVTYLYDATRTFNGAIRPVMLAYSLRGINQPCGLPEVANGNGTTLLSSTTGYTNGNYNSTGNTLCAISVSSVAP